MPFPKGAAQIHFLHAPRYVLCAGNEETFSRKVAQIRFRGGPNPWLVVDFPYTPYPTGLAMKATWNSDNMDQRTFEWLDPTLSMQTTMRPKYSHHQDGRAHFSQDGKIRTSITRQACPIREMDGHAFTLHIRGINQYPELSSKDMTELAKGKRRVVNFVCSAPSSVMLSIVGSVYTRESYYNRLSRRGIYSEVYENEYTQLTYRDGRKEVVALISDEREKLTRPSSLLLELSLSHRPLEGEGSDILLFLAGLDNPAPGKLRDIPGFLALRFPAVPDDRDISMIQSMDLTIPSEQS